MNQELLDYIKKAREAGQGNEGIKDALLGAGWQERNINEALESGEKHNEDGAVYKRSKARIVIAIIFIIPTVFIAYILLGDFARDGLKNHLFSSTTTFIVGIGIIFSAIKYAMIKDRYTYQDGKLKVDPEYYLRSTSAIGAGLFIVMGSIAVLAKLFSSSDTSGITYGYILLFFGIAIIHFIAYKNPNPKFISYLYIIIPLSVGVEFIVKAILTRSFDLYSLVILVVLLTIFMRKAFKVKNKIKISFVKN